MSKVSCLVNKGSRVPDNKETQQIQNLIGHPLTRVEMFENGKVYLEFDPYGSLTVSPRFGVELDVSTADPIRAVGGG